MTRRFAAIFGLLAFAGAILIGVFSEVSPMTRIGRAIFALLVGQLVGALAGSFVQRLVLTRFAQEMPEDVGGES